MSRIGRLPIAVPSGVDVAIDGQTVSVKGPKGELRHTVATPITVEREEDGTLRVQRPNDERQNRALHGLSRTLIANMITGVTEGYTKTLEIVGVGYRVQARGSDLEFALGFSHPVPVKAPAGITFAVETPTRLRVYAKSTGLPKVLGGLGVAIISTSTGLLTDKQANKKGVGGEVLAYVW